MLYKLDLNTYLVDSGVESMIIENSIELRAISVRKEAAD